MRLSIKVVLVIWALILMAGLIFEPPAPDLERVLDRPSWSAPMGRDSLGRNLVYRVLEGTAVSFLIGSLGLLLALSIGVLVGGFTGWSRSSRAQLALRAMDGLDALPDILLAAFLLLTLQTWKSDSQAWSFLSLAVVMGLTSWPRLARQVRVLILQEASKEYVLSARLAGVRTSALLWRHVRPNIQNSILRYALIQLPTLVLFEGTLSFFGLGIKPPQTSLGLLLQEGWRTFTLSPHLVWAPATALFLCLWILESLGRVTSQMPVRESLRPTSK